MSWDEVSFHKHENWWQKTCLHISTGLKVTLLWTVIYLETYRLINDNSDGLASNTHWSRCRLLKRVVQQVFCLHSHRFDSWARYQFFIISYYISINMVQYWNSEDIRWNCVHFISYGTSIYWFEFLTAPSTSWYLIIFCGKGESAD